MPKLFIAIFLYLFVYTVQAGCAEETVLGARYSMTSATLKGTMIAEKKMILWRSGHMLAHQYPASHITEIWAQSSNGQLKLVRHFDAYNRAIEYQPLDINNGKGERDWSLKSHLISQHLKDKMKLYDRGRGQACNRIEKYALKEPGLEIELYWLPRLQLVKRMTVTRSNVVLQWTLEDLEFDSSKVTAVFSSRAGHQLTDYIDIGDNESDPFLLKMMHLGSTQQGSSLVYETHGRGMATHAGHRH